MANKIKQLADAQKKNPHILSLETGLTYRVVLNLYKTEEIKPTTPIGTLERIALALGVKVSDLYQREVAA
jgi:DNA-binding Xre family transcriptional regulator